MWTNRVSTLCTHFMHSVQARHNYWANIQSMTDKFQKYNVYLLISLSNN